MTRQTKVGCRPIVLGAAASVLLLMVAGCSRESAPPRPTAEEPQPATVPTRVVRNDLEDFVGSEQCAKCHAEIAESYRKHPMAQSMIRVENESESLYQRNLVVQPGGMCSYEVRRHEDGSVTHHEIARDADGNVIYDQGVPVEYGIGSGARGRTYVCELQPGLFTESPISWYASKQIWDLSPGFGPDDPRRFSFRITAQCLSCHSGRPILAPGNDNIFAGFKELSIGCENCHGPGRQHVAYHEGRLTAAKDPIVNPGELDVVRRESVCNRCHLGADANVPRYGHDWLSFRPGEPLHQSLISFTTGTGITEEGKTKSVSHVVQMRASTCYQKSGGKLGCVSCHDPHSVPPAEAQVEFYRQRCLECHQDQGCSLPQDLRLARQADDSCIACHMPTRSTSDVPHAAQTDHQILRRPAANPPRDLVGQPEKPVWQLAFFDNADQHLSDWERQRALGLATIYYHEKIGEAPLLSPVERRLRPLLEQVPHDLEVLAELGTLARDHSQYLRARRYLERALEINPRHEQTLAGLVLCCWHLKDYKQGLEYMRQLEEENLQETMLYLYKAQMLQATGNSEAGFEAAEYGLEQNPRYLALRQWLTEAYRQAGRIAEADQHQAVIDQLLNATVEDLQKRVLY